MVLSWQSPPRAVRRPSGRPSEPARAGATRRLANHAGYSPPRDESTETPNESLQVSFAGLGERIKAKRTLTLASNANDSANAEPGQSTQQSAHPGTAVP
jgi:hypothetical protein